MIEPQFAHAPSAIPKPFRKGVRKARKKASAESLVITVVAGYSPKTIWGIILYKRAYNNASPYCFWRTVALSQKSYMNQKNGIWKYIGLVGSI